MTALPKPPPRTSRACITWGLAIVLAATAQVWMWSRPEVPSQTPLATPSLRAAPPDVKELPRPVLPALVGPRLPVKIVGPGLVDPYKLIELYPDQDLGGAVLFWDLLPEDVADVREYGSRLVFVGPPGAYKVKLRIVRSDDGKLSGETVRHVVIISGVPPGPIPPVPPVPPVPPQPDPAPIPLPGLRVMVVYDAAKETLLSQGQQDLLRGKQVRDYLNLRCTDDTQTNSKKAWWILPSTSDVSGMAPHWQAAFRRDRRSLPWVVVSNGGKGGYEGPLPDGIPQMLELLKKYE